MQTLLLVDDEPNIVEGLASQFEQRYGDGVIVLKSCSGRHALSVLQNNRVDVVLSDIRMPDLDGLELIEETERLWPRTHFVLLSGFEDFDYIHRASKSTIYRGYLLKSEGDEVVMEKVDKELRLCAEELREETQQGLQYLVICSFSDNVAAVCPKNLPEFTGFHVLTSLVLILE